MFPPRLPRRTRLGAALGLMLAVQPLAAAAERSLLMFERDGCSYCKRWDAEIAPAYPRTAEGQAAPLVRLDIHDPLPEGVTLTGRAPVFTPTFVLTDAGTEVGRIEGYAGDEFFWVMLAQMLTRTGWDPATPPRTVEAANRPQDTADPAPGTAPSADPPSAPQPKGPTP